MLSLLVLCIREWRYRILTSWTLTWFWWVHHVNHSPGDLRFSLVHWRNNSRRIKILILFPRAHVISNYMPFFLLWNTTGESLSIQWWSFCSVQCSKWRLELSILDRDHKSIIDVAHTVFWSQMIGFCEKQTEV